MVRALIKSALKDTIEGLPEDFVIKSDSALNVLKKRGVKDEELKFSGVQDQLAQSQGKVSKKQLQGMLEVKAPPKNAAPELLAMAELGASPEDLAAAAVKLTSSPSKAPRTQFKTFDDPEKTYRSYSMPQAKKEGSKYQEKVLQFTEALNPNRWSNPAHFEETPDYLLHTRVYRDTIDGKETHVIQEIQSDLHQQARQQAAAPGEAQLTREASVAAMDELIALETRVGFDDSFSSDYVQGAAEIAERVYGRPLNDAELEGFFNAERATDLEALVGSEAGRMDKIPESPYQKNWLRKGMEREVADAVNAGREQIAIPIKGEGVKDLVRGEGVQKWYETQVLDTAKKLAKSIGGEFKIVKAGGADRPPGFKGITTAHIDEMVDGVGGNTSLNDLLDEVADQLPQPGVPPIERTGAPALFRDAINDAYEGLDQSVVLELSQTDDPAVWRNLLRGIDSTPAPMSQDEALALTARVQELRRESNDVVLEQNGRTFDPEVIEDLQRQTDEINRQLRAIPGLETAEGVLTSHRVQRAFRDLEENPVGTEYAVIIPPKGKDLSFSLYSSGSAGALGAYMAIKAGNDPVQVKQYLMDDRELSAEEADQAIAMGSQIEQAFNAGYSEEDVKAFLSGKEVPFDTHKTVFRTDDKKDTEQSTAGEFDLMPTASAGGASASRGDEVLRASEVVAKLQTITSDNGDIIRAGRSLFSDSAARDMEATSKAQTQNIIDLAAKRGLELVYEEGEFKAVTPEGLVKVTPSILQEMAEAKGELVGAMAGGMGGFALPIPHPLGKVGASIVGAALGSIVGTELDYLSAAIELQEEFDAQLAMRKAMNTAAISAVMDVGGIGVFKLGAMGYRVVANAFNLVKDGNTAGAYRALKDNMFMSDDEVTEVVQRWEKLNDMRAPGANPKEKALGVIPTTLPGGENIVRTIANTDSQAAATVSREISQRAENLVEEAANVTADNAGKILQTDLVAYQNSVKSYYGSVKDQFSTHPAIQNRTFDAHELTLKPLFKSIKQKLSDPTVRKRFGNQAKQALQASRDRSPESLIELRQLVNDFIYNKNIRKQPDFKALRGIVDGIDQEIERAAGEMGPDGAKWLRGWQKANTDYAQMKALQKNVLFRAATRPGISEETLAKTLVKYVNPIDDTYAEVIQKIPVKSRGIVEGKVLQKLVDKHTGKAGSVAATNLPRLAEELAGIKFVSRDAARLQQTIAEMAKVYQNDPVLAQIAGHISIPKFQSYLTTDPVVRAKFELASAIFNRVKQVIPGAQADNIALVNRVGDLLETPLNAKKARELLAASDNDPRVAAAITAFQKQAASDKAAGKAVDTPRVKLYPAGKKMYSTRGAGNSISMRAHQIATEEHVTTTFGKTVDKLTEDEKAQLIEQGFKGALMGDKVRQL